MSYGGYIKDASGNNQRLTSTLYGTCDTAASTAAKVVTLSDYAYHLAGAEVRVKFTNANTASNPTLNINSLGAVAIANAGDSPETSWKAGSVVSFTYDGTNFVINNGPTGDSEDILETVGWVGSNLFEGLDTVSGGSGITVTRQNDKEYLVSGTNSSATDGKVYFIGNFTFKANVRYVIHGCPTGGGSTTSNFWLGVYVSGTSTIITRDSGEGRTYTPTQDTEADIKIRIPASYACPANFLWDVMISRNGGAYVPYHPTVQEELWDGEVSEPKNVLPIKVISTSNITSYTIDDDGGITIVKSNTTTNRGQVTLEIPSTVTGNWYYKACPSGGGSSNYNTYIWDSTASARCRAWNGTTVSDDDYGDSEGHEVQLVAGHNNLMQLYLDASYTTPTGGITFYPMLSLYKGAYSPYYVPLKDIVPTKCDNANIAPIEGPTASTDMADDRLIILDTELYRTTAGIPYGGSYVVGTNIEATTVANELYRTKGGRWIGTCGSAADAQNKEAYVDTRFKLVPGVTVSIKYSNTNTYANVASDEGAITLKVNNTGAYKIWYGATHSGAGNTGTSTTIYGYANRYITYMFDGTYWVWLGSGADSNTTYTPQSLGFGYGTCSTAEATVAKTASLSSYSLITNGIVAIKFTNAVPASATLNINSKGAKDIYYKGAAITADIIKAGDFATFIYDGSHYCLIAIEPSRTVDLENAVATIKTENTIKVAINPTSSEIASYANGAIWIETA